ncbi:MAG: hypothetical protein ACRD6W_19105 [Nitrososphaerales archaeon]
MAAGIAELAYFVGVGHPKSSGSQIQAYFLGFLLIMFGLVVAGPWFTMVGGRGMAGRTHRASVLIAGRRLSDNSRGAFRAISVLILAIFVTSASIGIIATLLADHGTTATGSPAGDTVVDMFNFSQTVSSVPSVAPANVDRLHTIEGVKGVTFVYTPSSGTTTDGPVPNITGLSGMIESAVMSCAQLARTPALGRCHPGATFAGIGYDIGFMPVTSPLVSPRRRRGRPRTFPETSKGSPSSWWPWPPMHRPPR